MSTGTITFEARQTRRGGLLLQVGLAAVAVVVLTGMAIVHRHVAPLVVAVVIALGVSFLLWLRKREMARSISVQPDERTVTFRNFVVVNSFWPQPPTPKLAIPFSDLIRSKIYTGYAGANCSLRIWTVPGRIDVRSDTMQQFDQLRELIERIVKTNKDTQQKNA